MARNFDFNVTQKETGQETKIATISKERSDADKSTQNDNKADVWKHFERHKDKGTATCNICNDVLKATGGCTSGLISHAKSKHGINVLKRKVPG